MLTIHKAARWLTDDLELQSLLAIIADTTNPLLDPLKAAFIEDHPEEMLMALVQRGHTTQRAVHRFLCIVRFCWEQGSLRAAPFGKQLMDRVALEVARPN